MKNIRFGLIFKNLFFNPSFAKAWILISLIIKGTIFAIFLSKNNFSEVVGFLGITSGDFFTYISPIENLLKHSSYFPDFRMPGYGAVYLLIRLIFDQAISLNILIFLQFFMSALSVYYLALIAFKLFNSTTVFFITFYLYAFSTFTSKFDLYTQPESFSIAALIFALYFFILFIENLKVKFLIFSGLFLCWLVFMRPVFIPIYLIFIIIIIFYLFRQKISIKKSIMYLVLLLLPLIIFDSIWLIRNFQIYHKTIFLQQKIVYDEVQNSYKIHLFSFIQSWGGDVVMWNPKAEIRWFGLKGKSDSSKVVNYPENLPEYIYTSKFNKDSLILIQNYISIINDTLLNKNNKICYDKILSDKLDFYTKSIINEKPLLYYLKAPLVLLFNFLIHPASYNSMNKSNKKGFVKKFETKYNNFLYLFVIISGLVGIIFLLTIDLKFDLKIIIPLIAIYSILLYPLFLRAIEYRYLAPAYPFILISSAYLINKIIKMWRLEKKQIEI